MLTAAGEVSQAARLAPWVAEYQFSRGVLLEKAGHHREAARALDLYLQAAPDAKDRTEVRELIAGLRRIEADPLPPLGVVTRPGLAAIREGLAYTRQRRAILGSFVIDLNAMIFGMPTSLFPVLALDVFGTGPAGLGLMAAAPAAGAFVAAVFSGWVKSVQRTGRAILLAVLGWGLAITAFGLVTVSFPLALVCLAVAGAADLFSAVFRASLVQLDTPDGLRGRVMSIHILVVTSGPRLGDIEAAVVAALTTPQFAVVSGGIACVIGVGVVARRFPQLATYRARTTVRSEA